MPTTYYYSCLMGMVTRSMESIHGAVQVGEYWAYGIAIVDEADLQIGFAHIDSSLYGGKMKNRAYCLIHDRSVMLCRGAHAHRSFLFFIFMTNM